MDIPRRISARPCGCLIKKHKSLSCWRHGTRMVELSVEEYICKELSLNEQKIALDFIGFLKDNHLVFYKDDSECWKDKIYYWVKPDNESDDCVCFIAIKDPDEKNNHWTVWSDDMSSDCLARYNVDNEIKELAWKSIDHCGHCGSCSGGRRKVIFGKAFDSVCGCTFRVDNPSRDDLSFLKKMVEIRIEEIKDHAC